MSEQERPGIATDRPVSASQAPEVHPDTPTVQDDWRAALAEALGVPIRAASWDTGVAMLDSDVAVFRERIADALLPTLRQIVAAELRSAAGVVAHTPGIKHQATAVNALNARADALDATPDHGKA